jgi:hypothetical protein
MGKGRGSRKANCKLQLTARMSTSSEKLSISFTVRWCKSVWRGCVSTLFEYHPSWWPMIGAIGWEFQWNPWPGMSLRSRRSDAGT